MSINKTRILCISRHPLLPEQMAFLKQAFGDFSLVMWNEGVRDAKHVLGLMRQFEANEVITILPLTIIQKLLELGIKPLYPEMELIHEGCIGFNCREYNPNRDYIDLVTSKHYRFKEFVKIIDIKIIKEKLKEGK
jgi:hypothetical protein